MNLEDITVGILATVPGIALITALILNLIRPAIDAATFDRIGALLGAAVGIILAVLYVVLVTRPASDQFGSALLGAILAGLAGGFLSQNVNTIYQRVTGNTPTT